MFNKVILVGRVVEIVGKFNVETNVKIAVQRPFKNEDANYDVDFIPLTCKGATANIVSEYLEKGDVIGVEGVIQCVNDKITVLVNKCTVISKNSTKK